MRKTFLIVLFVTFLLADLSVIFFKLDTYRYVTKPLLVPLLILFFTFSLTSISSSLKKWIVLALMFSWAGDVLLMFETHNSNYFIFGLVAFLIAHIFYILFYENLIRQEKIKRNYWLILPVLFYYVSLIWLLTPHLSKMKWPVWIYGLVISLMLMQALQTAKIKNWQAALWMITGAILFIASDSLLAINKFYKSFELAGIAVMLTYGLAQLMITIGAERYITSASKQ